MLFGVDKKKHLKLVRYLDAEIFKLKIRQLMCCATIRSDESHDSCDNRFANDLSSDQLDINLFF